MAQQKLQDGGEYIVNKWYGLKTAVKNPKELAPGQPQDSLNFITGYNPDQKYGDNIQLRLGSTLLTKTRLGAGKVNSLAVGQDASGNQIPFFAMGGQYYYYNSVTQDLVPVGNGTLAATEDMTLEYYQDLFGPYMYSGSPNTGINAISIPNKQMAKLNEGNISGYLTIRQNFGWIWNYLNALTGVTDQTDLSQSNPDQTSPSGSGISNPQGSTGIQGNGVLKTFSGTLYNFSPLAFAVQIAAPINSFSVTGFSIPPVAPFSSGFNISINYSGGFQFNAGDYVVLQGDTTADTALNDCIGIVQSVNGTSGIAVNFILLPSLANTSGGLSSVSVNTAGSGYSLGDILTIANGSNGMVQVNGVNGSGGITSLLITAPGVGYLVENGNAVTGGTGTGALINVTNTSSLVSSPGMTLSKVELFEDDKNGNLKSLLGSTGTINYVNGAFSINTQTAVPNGLNIDTIYFQGIPGVVDFPGNLWQQFGGKLEAVKFFDGQLYDFHTVNTWLTNLGNSFSSTTQSQYRQNLGTLFFRSAYEKGEGILFLDSTSQNNQHLRILQFTDTTSAIIPEDYSADMDFSLNNFSSCVVSSVGNYDFISCQSINNGVAKGYNDITYLRNNLTGFYDKLDYRIGVMDTYNGSILSGDTISQNIFQLFSGSDDDGSPINNRWVSGQDDFGFDGLKRFGFFHIDGFIGISQVLNIYAQFDTGNYVLIGSVYGNGKYIDTNNSVLIGQGLSGTTPIGGTGNGQVYGYHFEQDIPMWTPLFQYISIKFVAGENLSGKTPVPAFGALQINEYGFKDIRIKSTKALVQNIGR